MGPYFPATEKVNSMGVINDDKKVWNICKMPFWHSAGGAAAASSPSSSSHRVYQQSQLGNHSNLHPSNTFSSMAKSIIIARRRLTLDPPNKLYFPYEPGKQVKGAVRIKNSSRSHVAFKFQTTAPKSCYMRPPGGVLAPGESLVATVFKFVEPPENNEKLVGQKSRVKFKIMSLKVKQDTDFVPELFDEQRDEVVIEKILQVVFLDPEHPCPAMDKLNRQLAEAEASLETRKKPQEDTGVRIVGEGLVIDEWKERRERYLARQQVEGVEYE